MSTKRTFGIVLVILGIVLFLSSFYIKNRVMEGKKIISEAQQTAKQGDELFSQHPITKEIGKEVTKSIEKKIDEATKSANFYYNLSSWFKILGIILFVLGFLFIIFGKKKINPPSIT